MSSLERERLEGTRTRCGCATAPHRARTIGCAADAAVIGTAGRDSGSGTGTSRRLPCADRVSDVVCACAAVAAGTCFAGRARSAPGRSGHVVLLKRARSIGPVDVERACCWRLAPGGGPVPGRSRSCARCHAWCRCQCAVILLPVVCGEVHCSRPCVRGVALEVFQPRASKLPVDGLVPRAVPPLLAVVLAADALLHRFLDGLLRLLPLCESPAVGCSDVLRDEHARLLARLLDVVLH